MARGHWRRSGPRRGRCRCGWDWARPRLEAPVAGLRRRRLAARCRRAARGGPESQCPDADTAGAIFAHEKYTHSLARAPTRVSQGTIASGSSRETTRPRCPARSRGLALRPALAAAAGVGRPSARAADGLQALDTGRYTTERAQRRAARHGRAAATSSTTYRHDISTLASGG